MSRTTRTFIAVAVPSDRASKLERLQTLIAPELPGARWVAPDHFHSTLAFLGDVDDTDLATVCRAVGGAVAGFEPFELRLERLGVFPNPTRPRTVWVGLTGPGVEALTGLQKAVAAAVAGVGYPADDRFSPHVTLGRLKAGRGPHVDATPLLKHYQTWSAGSFGVAEIVTFSSTLTPEGPSYVALARAPLEGGKAQAAP